MSNTLLPLFKAALMMGVLGMASPVAIQTASAQSYWASSSAKPKLDKEKYKYEIRLATEDEKNKIKRAKDKEKDKDETETTPGTDGRKYNGPQPIVMMNSSGSGDVAIDTEYVERQNVEERLQSFDENILGDSVDLNSGSLSFDHIDVSLPGNSDLEVAIRRSRSGGVSFPHLDAASNAGLSPNEPSISSPFGDWSLEVPKISLLYPLTMDANSNVSPPDSRSKNLCTYERHGPSVIIVPGSQDPILGQNTQIMDDFETTNGMDLHIPGMSTQKLLWNPQGINWPSGAIRATKDNWFAKCGPADKGAEGFVVTAPNGNIYKFDTFSYRQAVAIPASGTTTDPSTQNINYWSSALPRVEVVLQASEVTDVHGNWVRYSYNSEGWVTGITSNDGRAIQINYGSNDLVSTVTANGRTWTYGYQGANGADYLSTVTRPDNQQWQINFTNYPAGPDTSYDCAALDQTITIEHPHGMLGSFTFTETEHVKGYVGPNGAQRKSCNNAAFLDDGIYDVMSLKSKTLSGVGYPSATWTYSYSEASGATIAGTKWGQVQNPLGHKVKTTYHNSDNVNLEGLPLKTERFDGSSLVQTNSFTYIFENPIGDTYLENENPAKLTRPRHTATTVTTQDGDTFTSESSYNTTQSSGTYSFGRPTQTRLFSNVSTAQRITDTAYEHITAKWILGLTKMVTQNSRQLATYTYDTDGQKTAQTRYGQSWRTFDYNTDGTLNWVKDALNRQVSPSLWKRGIPQRVVLQDGNDIERTVDDNGWVTSFTDQLNRVDSYQRDPMGRITLFDPHGSWDNTTISYNFAGGGATQTITKGQSKKTLTYDAMFRPILDYSQALDTGWGAYTNIGYDSLNRVTFKSQPSLYASETKGVNTSYDALGRVLTVAETVSPYATTTHSYHSGHRHRVTDPSGAWKDYYSYGYDGPNNTDYKEIGENGLRTTQINKNIYGQTTSVVQYGSMGGVSVNATQYFYYDNDQRLCRYRGLEGGDTLYNYNAAGEMSAYQKGLSAGTSCAAPSGIARVDQTYDLMGRPLITNFADVNTPDITRSYDAVGNLLTNNRGSGGAAANWTYSYNDADLLITENMQTDGKSYSLAYGYNTSGDMTHRTNPNGFQIAYAPDGLGRATKAQYQSTPYASGASYHVNGALAGFNYNNGFNFTQSLNNRQLPETLLSLNGGTRALDRTYSYDARAKITTVTDGADIGNNRTYGYDALGQMSSASGPWGSMSASYDSLGNMLSRNLGSRQINLAYNSLHRLNSYTDSAGLNKNMGYDTRGNVTSMTVPNTTTCIQSHSLTYQRNPNATLWTHNAQVSVCTGDVTLTTTSYSQNLTPNTETFYFSYIPAGTTQTVSKYTTVNATGAQFLVIVEASVTTNGVLSMRHRVQLPDGSYSGWVNHGSINFGPLTPPNTSNDIYFNYDYSDQPITVSGKVAAYYRYDGNFKRVRYIADGNLIYNIYNLAGELVHVDEETANRETDYVRLGGRTVARVVDKTTPTYVHSDHLGSPVARSDTGGTVLPRERYTPFGLTLNNPTDLDDQAGFTGHIKDSATGLNYMQARYYDPIIGRFLSVDPMDFIGSGGNPGYFNRYAYTMNDPVNNLDPDGRACVPCVIIAVAYVADKAYGAYDAAQTAKAVASGEISAADAVASQATSQAAGAIAGPVGRVGAKVGQRVAKGAKGAKVAKGQPPVNHSPEGAGRSGAFNQAKRDNNIPTSKQPDSVTPNVDKRGNTQPGRQYNFTDNNGNSTTIRDDAGGHKFPDDPSQNRGPHFNDDEGRHYDYPDG